MEKDNSQSPETQKPEQPSVSAPKEEVVTETKHSNNKALVVVLVVIGVLIVLGAVGTFAAGKIFKKAEESFVESATNTKITTNKDGTTTVESKDGSSSVTTSTEQKLPSDFPTGIPLLSSQKIISSYKNKNSSGNYWQVTSEVGTTVENTVTALKSKYAGWELSNDLESDGTHSMVYKKGNYSVTLTVSTSNNMTNVTYAVTEDVVTE